MPNQHKPNPTREELEPYIRYYYFQGKNDKEIRETLLLYHIDTTRYGLGATNFKKMRRLCGLLSTRQQAHSVETVKDDVQDLRRQFPNAGIREMISLLLTKKLKKVTRAVLEDYFNTFEPELKQARLGRKLKRRLFWAAGVNVLWCIDQHDKWKYKFGLCLHVGVDAFSGFILWLRIWWNNSNPILICNYYLDTVTSLGCEQQFILFKSDVLTRNGQVVVPLLTQSDPGTENTRVANAHSFMRQYHDPNLEGQSQHNWKRDKSNIKAEIEWSQLRRRWTAGYENMLEIGVRNGWYDMGNPIQSLLFRWVFVPFLQTELDKHRERVNSFPKRSNKHKLTPKGRPVDIHFRPERYESRDFKVNTFPASIEAARQAYVPQNHHVLKLVPDEFDVRAWTIFDNLGQPEITFDSAWDVYREMLEHIEVSIEVGFIPFDEVKRWSEKVVKEANEDDRATVEAEEIAAYPQLFDPAQPAPQGFAAIEDGEGDVPDAEWTDDEEGDGWLPEE